MQFHTLLIPGQTGTLVYQHMIHRYVLKMTEKEGVGKEEEEEEEEVEEEEGRREDG